MSSCPKGGEGADFHGGGSDLGRTRPLQLGGHHVIKTFWEAQSTSGLWRVSQECPCQGASKTGSVHNVRVPAGLRRIYEGSLKGSRSLLNA